MSDEKKLPKRRFKQFLNAPTWEQRKFTYLLDKKDGIRRGPFGSALKKSSFVKESQYTVYEQQNAIYDKFDTRYNITKEKFDELHKFQLVPGDFIMSGAGTIGRISRVPNGIKVGIFNQALIRFKIDETLVDSEYFLEWMRSEGMQKEFTKANPGSAMVNLVPMSEVKEWEVLLPTKNEQYKIGNLLSKISTLITLHQRKLNKLEKLKKAYLEELFPAVNQCKPKRRFKEFKNDWEQRKLGEVIERFEYGLNATAIDYDGVHKYIRITDVDDVSHKFLKSNLTTPKIDFQNTDAEMYKLKEGDILFARTGASVGKTYLYDINDGELYFAGFLIRGHVNSYNNAKFIYQNTLTENYDLFIKITSQRSGQPGVNAKEYAEFKLYIPSKEEQDKISSVLTDFDNLITLHQRKLQKLKKLKAAYLEELFV